jgi:hypothetical protein
MELLHWQATFPENNMGALPFIHRHFCSSGINVDLLDWSPRRFGNWHHIPHSTQRQVKDELPSTFYSLLPVDLSSQIPYTS